MLEVAACDGSGQCVGLFQRMRHDARVVLLQVPRTTMLWSTQPGHQVQEIVELVHGFLSESRAGEGADGITVDVKSDIHPTVRSRAKCPKTELHRRVDEASTIHHGAVGAAAVLRLTWLFGAWLRCCSAAATSGGARHPRTSAPEAQ